MSLIPIEHPHRLASPREAAAFFGCLGLLGVLGARRVSVRGLHTSEPARIARVVEAVETKREHTVSFVGGTLNGAAHDALDELLATRFEYFDLRTTDADLRVWPWLRSWVHSSRDRAAASRALGVELHEGDNTTPDARIQVHAEGAAYPVHVETTSIPPAARIFRALSGERVARGFVTGITKKTKPPLLRFLTALGTRVDAVLELDLAAARSLTELYAGEQLDWQADGVLVDFPEGRVHGFLKTPNTGDCDRERWLDRVTTALRRAGVMPS